jgi:hypothetical protein
MGDFTIVFPVTEGRYLLLARPIKRVNELARESVTPL